VSLRPTPAEERWITLAQQLHRGFRVAPFAERTGGWKVAGLPSRCTFFLLGLVAAGMISVIVGELQQATDFLIIAGFISLAMAEWLIVNRRYFWSGIEEALEIAGLLMLFYECWIHMSLKVSAGAYLLGGAAFAIAGMRLLNPLFTTLAALAFVLALKTSALGAGLLCYGIGLAALTAGAYRFRRPSHDLMFDALVVVMPVAGYLWSASPHGVLTAVDYLHGKPSAWLVPICSLTFAGIALVIGLLRRAHAPLIAFILGVACTAYELRALTGLALEVRLIAWGCVLLLVSVALERYLRVPRSGITSRQLRDEGDQVGMLGMAASAVLTPHSPPVKASPSFEPGGGRFGGGGASGSY
jgi:hypothetical protein